jgi:hypothetical protein
MIFNIFTLFFVAFAASLPTLRLENANGSAFLTAHDGYSVATEVHGDSSHEKRGRLIVSVCIKMSLERY